MFFFNDTATTEIYTLSLHDALPIYLASPPARLARRHHAGPPPARADRRVDGARPDRVVRAARPRRRHPHPGPDRRSRSEEHTSELQSRQYLVCRLLLEKKKNTELSK